MRVTAASRARRGAILFTTVIACALPGVSTTAHAGSVRVPADYFGINLQNLPHWSSANRERHLAAIADAGVSEVRVPIAWQGIESRPPSGGQHYYYWTSIDEQIGALARHGLRAQALFAYAPDWAASGTEAEQDSCREQGAAGLGTSAPSHYATAAKALAARYGPGGDFWSERPHLAPQPIRMYEIWNAPNTAGAWCPQVDPEGYGIMFTLAAKRIREVTPNAEVVVGGVGSGAKTQYGSLATADFLRRMVIGSPPAKHAASAVGIHTYPGKNLDLQLNALPKLREWIRAAGFPDTTPMLLNEIGFSRVGGIPMTEQERALSYRNVGQKVARTNCNLNGVLPYTWATNEQGTTDAESWFGIASPSTSALYPSGAEYFSAVRLFRGKTAQEAPRETLMLCPGMPKPDSDKDGVRDENDYFPLDPSRSDPGGGGGGSVPPPVPPPAPPPVPPPDGGVADCGYNLKRIGHRLKRVNRRFHRAKSQHEWHRYRRLWHKRERLRLRYRAAKLACE